MVMGRLAWMESASRKKRSKSSGLAEAGHLAEALLEPAVSS